MLRRIPTAAWLCAAVACLNAMAWSIVTPPFQVPDEPEHFAYVKELVDRSRLPAHAGGFSTEEETALADLRLQFVAERPAHHPIATRVQQQKLEQDMTLAERSPLSGGESAGVASSEPPLYYALESVAYRLGEAGTLLDRLELMRLLSALMGGVAALFTCLFLRELLPGADRAWAVGGFAAALVPSFGFMSGAVNPDVMLFAVSAALFYCLARGFRRGLSRRGAVCLGGVIAVGFATKLSFLGLAPGALLGLIVLSVRAARSLGRKAYVSLAIGLALAIGPPLVYVLGHVASGAPVLGIVSSALSLTSAHGSLGAEVSYIWQLYLPRLPGMRSDFAGLLTTRQLWFNGYVGLYGWLDTTFPGWVYDAALVPAALIAGLCIRTLAGSVTALRARTSELGIYCVVAIGLMLLIGADSYLTFPRVNAEYAQVRYLLPLLALFGAVIGLASRGAGRRWAQSLGALLIALFLAYDILSQLQVVARFYG